MSVSISVQFTGQIDGANHRKVISDIKTAIEIAMKMNGIDATLYGTENLSVVTARSFPDGKSSSTYPNNSITFGTGFHVNEDPVKAPAPVESPAEAVAPAAPAESDTTAPAPSASTENVESAPSESTPVEAPAPAEMPAPESSTGTGETQA